MTNPKPMLDEITFLEGRVKQRGIKISQLETENTTLKGEVERLKGLLKKRTNKMFLAIKGLTDIAERGSDYDAYETAKQTLKDMEVNE